MFVGGSLATNVAGSKTLLTIVFQNSFVSFIVETGFIHWRTFVQILKNSLGLTA